MDSRSQLLRGLILAGLYAACAGVVLLVFVRGNGINYMPAAKLEDMIYGSAEKPYVQRMLLPAAVRLTAGAGEAAVDALGLDQLESWTRPGNFVYYLTKPANVPESLSFEYAICFGWMYVCLLGFACLLRLLIRRFYDRYPSFVGDLAPAFAVVLLPPIFFRYVNYVYDPATLCTFTLGIYAVFARRHAVYYPALALAAVNKETAVLLPALFWLEHRRRMPGARLAMHLAAQLAVYGAVGYGKALLFRDNPGASLELQLFVHNLPILGHVLAWVFTLGVVIPLALLVIHGWRSKPRMLRNGLALTGLPLAAAAPLFGFIDELRIFYEIYPFVVLLALPTVVGALGVVDAREPTGTR